MVRIAPPKAGDVLSRPFLLPPAVGFHVSSVSPEMVSFSCTCFALYSDTNPYVAFTLSSWFGQSWAPSSTALPVDQMMLSRAQAWAEDCWRSVCWRHKPLSHWRQWTSLGHGMSACGAVPGKHRLPLSSWCILKISGTCGTSWTSQWNVQEETDLWVHKEQIMELISVFRYFTNGKIRLVLL